MPKKQTAVVYSVKFEVDGATKILTVRVGKHFTELSLMKNGRLTEIMREENGEINHQKMK